MTNQNAQSNQEHLSQELLIQAVSTIKSLEEKINKINKREEAEEIKKKKTQTKLIKSRKLGKKIFLWSLFFLVISITFKSMVVLVFPSIICCIISFGMWKGDPNYRQNFSSRNSLDYITDPTYSYHAGNIYNRR